MAGVFMALQYKKIEKYACTYTSKEFSWLDVDNIIDKS